MSIVIPVVDGASSLGVDTSSGDASAWHLKTGKKAWVDGAEITGTAYNPAMMVFDGSTAVYTVNFTSAAHTGITFLARFKLVAFSGGSIQYICHHRIVSDGRACGLVVNSSDHATAGRRSKLHLFVTDSAGSNVARLFSSNIVADGLVHSVFASYNAAAGTGILRIDGVDVLDAGNAEHVLTTGTLSSGAGVFGVGGQGIIVPPTPQFTGDIGFVGGREVSLTNWSDFMQTDGSPKELDETTWAEWSGGSVTSPQGRPLFWNPHGDMVNNLGSAGAMTKNGTINVGNGGST